MTKPNFEWDERKDAENQAKHGIPFAIAQYAFADERRVIAEDTAHSAKEKRYFCFGACRRRRADRPVHVPGGRDPDIRCRLLAQRKGNL